MTEAATSVCGHGGFALEEYTVTRFGPDARVRGGTMSKSSNEKGGMHDAMGTSNERAPGPGFYFKEKGSELANVKVSGGGFSKLTRDQTKKKEGGPSVGQYDIAVPSKMLGGIMSRRDRVCAFAKMAERLNQWNSNGPGKYDLKPPPKSTGAPLFVSPRNESRQPRNNKSIGPGYYNPDYRHTDKRVPEFSCPKEEIGSYMIRVNKDKNATPFPWYKDMPESKVHDKGGMKKHCKTLLKDRIVPPRKKPTAASARSRRYSAQSPELPPRPASEMPPVLEISRPASEIARPASTFADVREMGRGETPRLETPRPGSVQTPRPPPMASQSPRPATAQE